MAVSNTTTLNDVQLNAAIEARVMQAARARAVFTDKILAVTAPDPGPISVTMPRWQAITIAATTEATDQTGVAASTDGVTITMASRGAVVPVSDEAISGGVAGLSQQLIENMSRSVINDIETQGLALATGLSTNVVGTSAAPLTVDDFLSALSKLEAANAPVDIASEPVLGMAQTRLDGYICVLHPTQVKNLRAVLAGSSAAVWSDSMKNGLAAGEQLPSGFVGRLFGVYVYQSSLCPLSDGDANANGIFFSPAFAGFAAKFIGRVEVERRAIGRASDYVITSHFGFAELVDAYGVRVRSSAT